MKKEKIQNRRIKKGKIENRRIKNGRMIRVRMITRWEKEKICGN